MVRTQVLFFQLCLTIAGPGPTQAQGTSQGQATALSFTGLTHLP